MSHVIALNRGHLWGWLHQLSLLIRDLVSPILGEKGNLVRVLHLHHLLLHFLVFQGILALLNGSLDDFMFLRRVERIISRNGRVVRL